MNRKAVATGSIVVIILGFLVLLLILNGPLKTGYDYAQEKFFGKRGILSGVLPSRESEFQPYSGQIQLSSEEKIVDDSVKAFICAVNSLALGKPGWLEKDVCPAGFTFPGMPKKESTVKAVGKAWSRLTGAVTADQCTGALYGQSCVDCTTLEQGMKTIQLSEYDYPARSQIVDEVIDCWKNFESGSWKSVYCAKAVISVTNPSWMIAEADFREQLNNQPGIGDDIAGKWWKFFEVRGKKYKWLLPDPLMVNPSAVYICGRTRIAHGSDSAHNIILTFDISDCEVKGVVPEKEFRCSVRDFELPQKLGSSILPANMAQDIMEQYIDPKYLVYYEKFPVAEASAWQINQGSFIIDVVLIGAGFNAIPVLGHYGKGILAAGKGFLRTTKGFITRSFYRIIGRESKKLAGVKTTPAMYEALFKRIGSQELAAEFGEIALREVLQGSNAKGYELLMRSERLYQELSSYLSGRMPGFYTEWAVKGGDQIAQELSEKIREVVLKKYGTYSKLSDDAVVDAMSKDVLQEIRYLTAPTFLAQADADAIKAAISKFVKMPLTEAELLAFHNQQVVKQFFVKYLIAESGEGLSDEGLKKVFSSSFSKEFLESLDTVAATEVSERTVGYANSIIDASKDGGAMWETAVLGTSAVTSDLEKVVVAVGSANEQNIQNFFTGMDGRAIQTFFMGNSFKDFAEFKKALAASLTAAPARYNPLYLTWEGVTWKIPGDLVLWSILKSTGGTLYKLPKAGVTLAYDVAWRPRIVRYSLSYIIGSAITKADATNEKYRTKGGDSIVLQKPYYYDKNKVYSLSADTSDFFLGLLKFDNGKNGLSRFFMVSPCKADLMISRTKCACDYGNGAYLLMQEDTTQAVTRPIKQPISRSSIIPESADALINIHLFDEESADVQKQLVSWCAEWGNVDSFSSKCGNTMANNPDAYNKFLKYVYAKVYVQAVKFLANHGDETFPSKTLYELLDEKIHKPRDFNQGSVAKGLANFAAMQFGLGGESIRSIYERADEFPGFYVASGMGKDTSVVPHIFAPMLVESGPLEPGPSDVVVFRKTPLSFDEFKIQFESSVFSSWAQNPIPEIYMTLVDMNKKYPRTFTDLLNQNQFFWAAANNTLLNYYLVYDFRIDKTKVVKQCDMSSMNVPDISDVMTDFDKGRSVVNCFSAQASLESGYNHGNNYCFTGDISYIANAKWIATCLAVAMDLGVAMGTGGTSALVTPVATGFVSAWFGHWLDKQQWWPHH